MKNIFTFYTELITTILDSSSSYIITFDETDFKLVAATGKNLFEVELLRYISQQLKSNKSETFGILDLNENQYKHKFSFSKGINTLIYAALLDSNNIAIGYLLAVIDHSAKITSSQKKSLLLVSGNVSEKLQKNKSITTKDLKSSQSTDFKLNVTKEILKKTFKFSNDVFCIFNKDQKFEFVSNASLNIWGYTSEEMKGKSFENYIVTEDLLESLETEHQAKNNVELNLFESRCRHKNGTIKSMMWSANWDEESELLYCIGKDVTDFKKIIKKSEENKSLLLEAQKLAKMGSWNFDFKDDKLTWSDGLYNVFDVDKELFLETHGSFIDFIIPEDRDFVVQTSKNTQETGDPFTIVYRIKTPSGEQRFVEEFGYSEKDATGKITRLFGTAQDVTERKKNELLLEDSNKKYKYLFDNSPTPLFIWDFETLEIIDCNIESLMLYGYTREEFLQLTIKDIRPKEDIDLIVKATGDESIYGDIHKKGWRHLKKNGDLMYVDITAHLLDYNNRRCSLVLINDITAKIELEKKQQEHIQFIETTLENLPIGIAVNKIDDGSTTLMNQQFSEIYGWPKQDLTDVATFFEKVYPGAEYREKIVNQVIRDMSSKDPERMNWEGITITTQNGTKKIINAKNIPIYDQNVMISTVVDVTEKFIAQKSLLLSNERYHYATLATSDAIWDWDFENNLVYRAEGFKTIFGCEMEELNLPNTSWDNYIHPDDKDSVTKSINEMINSSGNYWKQDYRIIKPDGQIAFVQDSAYIIRGENNNVTRIIGALQDVTQRKKEEQQLKLFASVATNSLDSVLITEAEPFDEPGPRILYVNDAFTNMTGYTAEEVMGKTPRILQGPKSDRAELKRLGEAIRRWESCEATIINYKKNGEEFWINFTLSPVADEKGCFTHWIAIERDVTLRKNEELQNELIADISTVFNEPLKLHETLDRTLRYIANFGNFCFAEAWLASSDQNILNKISSHAATENINLFLEETNSIDTSIHGEGFSGIVAKTKEIIIWGDLANQKLLRRRDAALKYGLKTILGLPLLYNNEVMGVLAFGLDHEVIDTAKYHTLFKKLGDYLGPEIKRKQLELELNKMFNFAPDMIVTIGLDSRFKRVNPATCQLLGYTQEELCAEHYTYFVHPEDREKSDNEISKLLETNLSYNFENRYITKSGKTKWLTWNAIYVLEDNNIYAVAKDVTDKKELENLLNKANELARIGGWEVDLLNNTVFWSEITKEIHETESSFVPDLATGLNFYKEGTDRELITQKVKEAIELGKAWDVELEIVTAKNNIRWIRTIGETEFVEGNCVRIYGSFQDIDERKKAEEELKNTEERSKLIMNSALDAIICIDKDGMITFWNPQAEKIFGWSENEVMGKVLSTIIIPENFRAMHDNGIKNYLKTGKGSAINVLLQLSAIRRNGTEFPIELTVLPIRQDGEEFFCAFIRDITDRKTHEDQLLKLNADLNKQTTELITSNKELEQFAYVASHDLQEPLRMVTSFLALIEKKYEPLLDDNGKKYIHFAVDGAKRMRQIILDLLDFSRVGKEIGMNQDIDINEIIEEIRLIYNNDSKTTNVIIEVANQMPIIRAQKLPLRQVFQNIISNGIKYRSENRDPIININYENLPDYHKFTISDNGIGIEPEYFEKIFKIFQRLHQKEEYEGTGIGLAIAKKIVENLGGSIGLTSRVGQGSSFYFTIRK